MKRSDFEEKLREFGARATSIARARMLLRELTEAAPRMNAELRSRLQSAASTRGITVGEIPPAALRIGEAWLLLFEAPANACVASLRALLDGRANEGNPDEVRRAFRGVVRAAGRACRLVDRATPPSIYVDAPYAHFEVEGSSLGLSVACAVVSLLTERAPDTSTAASAQVLDDGALAPVQHLAEKIAAVARERPEIRRIVVAKQQVTAASPSSIEVVGAGDVGEALALCGLDINALPDAHLETFSQRLGELRKENSRAYDVPTWRELSMRAHEIAGALQAEYREEAVEAVVLSALFAVHAGDAADAGRILRDPLLLGADDLVATYPELQVPTLIANATTKIDLDDCETAAALASRAVILCDELGKLDRNILLGQALGTHGRALLHAGKLVEAEPLLRAAFDHHSRLLPRERPRSACYLATCLRKMGRLEEALELIDRALVDVASSRLDAAVTTGLYLRLERGRILLERDDPRSAIAELELVKTGQTSDFVYPRAGALRDLARAYRRVERQHQADEALMTCVSTARSTAARGGSTLTRVAAAAAGEAILDGVPCAPDGSSLSELWSQSFGTDGSPDRIREVLRRWIY